MSYHTSTIWTKGQGVGWPTPRPIVAESGGAKCVTNADGGRSYKGGVHAQPLAPYLHNFWGVRRRRFMRSLLRNLCVLPQGFSPKRAFAAAATATSSHATIQQAAPTLPFMPASVRGTNCSLPAHVPAWVKLETQAGSQKRKRKKWGRWGVIGRD